MPDTPTPEQIEKWSRLAEECQKWGGKWYTAEELSQHRAMPASDALLIAAMSPATVKAWAALVKSHADELAALRERVINECISAIADISGPDPEDGEYESGHLDGRLRAIEKLRYSLHAEMGGGE